MTLTQEQKDRVLNELAFMLDSNSLRTADSNRADAEDKVSKVMREFKQGKLKSSSGKKVKSRKQAIAIALSEAERSRQDDNSPVQQVIKTSGFDIGLQYKPGSERHGRTLEHGYGHIRKHQGDDGMALDCYVHHKVCSGVRDCSEHPIFVIDQLKDGEFDEGKLFLGFKTADAAEKAYKKAMPPEMFGGIRELNEDELKEYRVDAACGRGWTGTKPPGCTRAKKGTGSKKTSNTKIPIAKPSAVKSRASEILKAAKDSYQAEDHLGGAKGLIKDAETKIKRLLNDADVMIRIPSSTTLEKIIDSGRFKTQFETGKSGGGKTDRKLRKHAEKEVFGIDENTDPKDRPIYGYMGDRADEAGNGSDLKFYGGVSLRLKPSVRTRTTVTGGDSLPDDATDKDVFLPTGLNNPSISSFFRKQDLDIAGDKLEGMAYAKSFSDLRAASGQYIEAQIHGGVRSEDIAEVAFLKGKPSNKVKQWAATNGVKLIDKAGKEIK